MTCNCICSTFGGQPHDAEARHPNPKACIHAQSFASDEQSIQQQRHPYTCGGCSLEFMEKAAYDAHVALWTWHNP